MKRIIKPRRKTTRIELMVRVKELETEAAVNFEVINDMREECIKLRNEIADLKAGRRDKLDEAIDSLHQAARKMKAQCERERIMAERMFISRT